MPRFPGGGRLTITIVFNEKKVYYNYHTLEVIEVQISGKIFDTPLPPSSRRFSMYLHIPLTHVMFLSHIDKSYTIYLQLNQHHRRVPLDHLVLVHPKTDNNKLVYHSTRADAARILKLNQC